MKDITLDILPRAPSELVLEIEKGFSPQWYEGPYEVTPTRSVQTLPTGGLTMREDVSVHEIPYYETANPYGKTYIIGE